MSRTYIQTTQTEAMELDKDCIVLDLEQYTATQLNEVGSFCWRQLVEARSLTELVESVMNEFEISAGAVEADIALFLEDLLARGLIRIAGE
ncbi:PqqD family protein [Paenibacillus soyae]|uniref:PqqD family protein n=1 Tax=Paenibacillus soyae TaxID=2969249 RepID=A0A9X2SDS7_9BACL|nr:PqqD family protein [Paenibacillus soyae]MCR2807412.1 PqqD family protein [Paenibacillus soyae]